MESLKIEYRGFVIVPSDRIEGWFMTECLTMCGETVQEVKDDLDDHIRLEMKGKKITAYFQGDFGMGITKIEGRMVDFGTSEYAQYGSSPFLKMIPKRKRNVRGYRQSYKPYMVILEGHGHPDPDDGMIVTKDVPGLRITTSKYSSCDPRWTEDADEMMDKYLEVEGVKVIADYRESKGFCSYSKQQSKAA